MPPFNTAVVAMVLVLGGGWLPAIAANGGPFLSLVVFVVELAGAIAIAAAIWLRRMIVIDSKMIALTGFWSNVVASCQRSQVASVQSSLGSGDADIPRESRLCNSSGRPLLTIPTGVIFTYRQIGWLASYLAAGSDVKRG